jgi:hypothetical protein
MNDKISKKKDRRRRTVLSRILDLQIFLIACILSSFKNIMSSLEGWNTKNGKGWN